MTEKKIVKPLSGFPEYTPQEQIVFNRMIEIVRRNFELHGFTPIETPAVERKTTLEAKGGDEKEIYALSRLKSNTDENDQTEMALHFDLTVPLARYVSMHLNEITFPFRRYQIQKVWRGERPQAGRYREFYQCDIDVIGREKLSLHADAEMPAIIAKIFTQMNIGDFTIYLNNRKYIQGFLLAQGIEQEDLAEALHIIDKRDKVGREKMIEGLEKYCTEEVAESIANKCVLQENPQEVLEQEAAKEESLLTQGARELRDVLNTLPSLGIVKENIALDFGIVRGLDYYTGTVYETVLAEYPELGSVCSGGRYENLSEQFSSQKMPGVGISIGLSRIMTHLFVQGAFETDVATPSYVLVTTMDDQFMDQYIDITKDLRAAGIPSEMYTEGGKFEKQMKYANAKGITFAIIMGENEQKKGHVRIKNLIDGSESEVKKEKIIEHLAKVA